MAAITFQGSRADLVAAFRRVVDILAGKAPDAAGVASGVLSAVGFAALSDIKTGFVAKARGGTDEMGVKWPKLSREYLAYGRRFGRGEQTALKKAAGLGRANSRAPGGNKGLLTAGQLKEWRRIFAYWANRFSLSMDLASAKSRAAQIAWSQLKAQGAHTKLEVFGSRQVEILRDTGVLLNSLSPGVLTDSGYSKPSGEGGDQQIFQLGQGKVIVGTEVPYAGIHNFGKPGKMPRRQFLPDDESQIPDAWWERWADVAAKAAAIGVRKLLAA